MLFHDAHHIFVFLLGDVGFLFIEVLMVSLIIHHVLSEREKKAMIKKLNMVIGAFFSETGTSLLKKIISFDTQASTLSEKLTVDAKWSANDFERIEEVLAKKDFDFRI